MRRSLVLGLLTALGSVLLPSGANDTPAKNGATWKNLSEQTKSTYVLGVMDGTFQEMTLADPKLVPTEVLTDEEAYLEGQKSLLLRKDGRTPSPAEIANGINTFYQVSDNLPICWSHAALIEWMSLAGNPLTTTESDLASARKTDGQSGCN